MTTIHLIYFNIPEMKTEGYDRMLYKCMQSIKINSPKCKVVLHEKEFNNIGFHTPKVNANYAKLKLQVEIAEKEKEDFIFMDCDMLVAGELSDAFSDNFDIAFTKTYSKNPNIVPINAGVLFCRENAKHIFKKWLSVADYLIENIHIYNNLYSKHKGICQASLAYMLENNLLLEHEIKYLPCSVWNSCQYNWEEVGYNKDVKCLHLNSGEVRKSLMSTGTGFDFVREVWHKYKDLSTDQNKDTFEYKTGYKCNYNNPQTFNEKIQWKKNNDRSPLIPFTSDKLQVRHYVASKGLEKILVPLLWAGNKIKTTDLRVGYLKVNNASGKTLNICKDSDREQIVNLANSWLTQNYGTEYGEWGYQCIIPNLLIEKKVSENAAPCIKALCFNGKVEFFYMQKYNSKFKPVAISLYNKNWELQLVKMGSYEVGIFDKPKNIDEIIKTCEVLAADFDFVRVDLMIVDDNIYFSELTHYPTSGCMKFDPIEFDNYLGTFWNITNNKEV